MRKIQYITFLVILGLIDAYLISHPNFIGKLGIFLFKYEMIRTLPKAILTVFITLGISWGISLFFQKYIQHQWAKNALIIMVILSISLLIQIIIKFSSGTYAHTGQDFKFGLMLLPILMTIIFSSPFFEKK